MGRVRETATEEQARDVMSMSFSYSKIVQCTIQNSNKSPRMVSRERTSYRSVLIDVFTSFPQPVSTRFKVVSGNMYGVNGYQWCKALDISVQNKSATDTLREIVQLVRDNQYSLAMVVDLQNGETVGIAV